MEHRICVCVAAIGLATIGHQAQGGTTSTESSATIGFDGWSTENGFNAIGIEMFPRVVVDVSVGDTTVFDIDRPSSPIPFDDPFTSFSDDSWSNVDPSGLPSGPERAAAAGNNIIGDGPDGELTFDIQFEQLNPDDAFAFSIYFFEEGEETTPGTAASTGSDLLIWNVFPTPDPDDDRFQLFPRVIEDADAARTRADFGMSVIPMPHPAGMAGVGLAGVAMVRRRRSV